MNDNNFYKNISFLFLFDTPGLSTSFVGKEVTTIKTATGFIKKNPVE